MEKQQISTTWKVFYESLFSDKTRQNTLASLLITQCHNGRFVWTSGGGGGGPCQNQKRALGNVKNLWKCRYPAQGHLCYCHISIESLIYCHFLYI